MSMIVSPKHLFDTLLPAALARHAEEARKVGASYAFHITGEGGGDWLVDLKTDPPTVRAAEVGTEANCAITVSAEDFARMLGDSALMLQFYFNGKLKVSGDPMLAAKLQKLFALVGT